MDTRIGNHTILDLYGCDPERINDPELVEATLIEAARRAEATVLWSHLHRFEPHGVTGVVLIAESHISIHTWPEHGFAAVDVFICGSRSQIQDVCESIANAFSATRTEITDLPRGTRVPALSAAVPL